MTAACTGNKHLDTGLAVLGTSFVVGAALNGIGNAHDCITHRTHKHTSVTHYDHYTGHRHTHVETKPVTRFYCGDDRHERLEKAKQDEKNYHHGR